MKKPQLWFFSWAPDYINTTLFYDSLYEDPNNTYTPNIIHIPYHTI